MKRDPVSKALSSNRVHGGMGPKAISGTLKGSAASRGGVTGSNSRTRREHANRGAKRSGNIRASGKSSSTGSGPSGSSTRGCCVSTSPTRGRGGSGWERGAEGGVRVLTLDNIPSGERTKGGTKLQSTNAQRPSLPVG